MIVIMQEALPCAIGATGRCHLSDDYLHRLERRRRINGNRQRTSRRRRNPERLQVNPIKAIIPIIPLALLVLASKQVGVLPTKAFSVPVCMLIGTAIGLIVALVNKQKIGDASKKFCRGAGDGFCDVVILIAAAAMFASGMKAIA